MDCLVCCGNDVGWYINNACLKKLTADEILIIGGDRARETLSNQAHSVADLLLLCYRNIEVDGLNPWLVETNL